VLSASEPALVSRPTVKQAIADANDLLVQQGTATHVAVAQRAEALYRLGSSPFSMLTALLLRARDHVAPLEPEWRGSEPKNGVLDVEWCLEFYRVWSAVQFAYCTPSINEKEFTSRYFRMGTHTDTHTHRHTHTHTHTHTYIYIYTRRSTPWACVATDT
jgi:hypothetical protein